MGKKARELKYWEALSEGLVQAMEADDSILVMGIGVDDPKGIFGTTLAAHKTYGDKRVLDVPISENTIAGIAIGAAMSGIRPVIVHARNDFVLLSFDQLINNAAKLRYMSGGLHKVPLTVRAIIGRGWGQGAQHSQSLQALFMHVPGLKVVMPATPYDAKGLLISSIQDDSPVIFIEHRRLYDYNGPVPKDPYTVPIGKGIIHRKGKDVTIVATSRMVMDALDAAEILKGETIEVEVIDPRTLRPLDDELILNSVAKTGRLLIADTGWETCGVGAEISARVVENAFDCLKAPIRRISLADVPAPVSAVLEKSIYPSAEDIADAVLSIIYGKNERVVKRPDSIGPLDKDFLGPF
ncbi:alpha-ketoacid dehydrogenase subunit beta [Chloroflexota bacterium]